MLERVLGFAQGSLRRKRAGNMSPALFESGPLLSGSRNPYSWGVRTRSPSAVVASPGSVATWWILLPGAKQIQAGPDHSRPRDARTERYSLDGGIAASAGMGRQG